MVTQRYTAAMKRGSAAFALASMAVVSCLKDNPTFVEPIGVYGDCADLENACQSELACNDVEDPRQMDGGGAYCTANDCEDASDCPRLGDAAIGCDPDGNCVISCTPLQRCQGSDCEPCSDPERCAERCGDASVGGGEGFVCVYCPEDWRCIGVKPGNMANPLGLWQCVPA